ASLALARSAACASRSACRCSTAGSLRPGLARNFSRMLFLASCAAFCRSAKLGSLNPLIERALLLSWFVVRLLTVMRSRECQTQAEAQAIGSGVQPPGP